MNQIEFTAVGGQVRDGEIKAITTGKAFHDRRRVVGEPVRVIGTEHRIQDRCRNIGTNLIKEISSWPGWPKLMTSRFGWAGWWRPKSPRPAVISGPVFWANHQNLATSRQPFRVVKKEVEVAKHSNGGEASQDYGAQLFLSSHALQSTVARVRFAVLSIEVARWNGLTSRTSRPAGSRIEDRASSLVRAADHETSGSRVEQLDHGSR